MKAVSVASALSVLSVLSPLSGCSKLTLWNAERMEKRGAHAQAAKEYAAFASQFPKHPRAPEAAYKAAAAYGGKLGRCSDARPLYEDAARSGVQPWADQARAALLECPDYFPMRAGLEWTYGDAQTGGRNMKETVTAKSHKDGALFERKLFAGNKLVETRSFRYTKSGWEIRQDGQPVLKFPFRKGASWTVREGKRTLNVSIAEADVPVRSPAGRFEGCLKVKVQVAGMSEAWKYDYYCPGVGRVKTTVAGPGFEHPNTELQILRDSRLDPR